MYDELIKDLREWPRICVEYTGSLDELHDKAADAIEELSRKVEDYETRLELTPEAQYAIDKHADDLIDRMNKLIEGLNEKPRWIPVTERLPEKTNHYLVHVKCGCDREIVSAWEQVAWFCEKFYWEHLHGDDVFEETITHWMPLPEPPKEE